jgi:hypothetical protein
VRLDLEHASLAVDIDLLSAEERASLSAALSEIERKLGET